KQGYFPVPPMDKFQDIRSDMVLALESVGVRVEVHHHEVATGGQTEVDMRFDTLTKMADKVMWYKYCAKNTARKWGKTATFMPKPLFQDNGSGCTPTSHSGRAERTSSMSRAATPTSPRPVSTISAAFSSTLRRCWR